MSVYNYNHLYYFYVIANLEGFTAAAKQLNTSQSSLSTQIKILEDFLGQPLFRKSGRKIELTEYGAELFQYCRRAFETFEEMSEHLNNKNSSAETKISIGVSNEIDRPFFTNILAKASRSLSKNDRPTLNLHSTKTSELALQLKAGSLDLMIATQNLADKNIELIHTFSLPVGAFSSKEIANSLKGLSFDEILKSKEIGFSLPSKLTELRNEIDTYFIKKKIQPKSIFESNILASVNRAAADGLGIVLMPEAYISSEVSTGKLIKLNTKLLWKHHLFLLGGRKRLDTKKKTFSKKVIEAMS